ncbi:MAG: VOC family protein [Gammaproteobacteria bacterium]|jgi:catechol 2,3-dioxygenase-like lactoylglutathione lyase family enzyme|nr:VOC family protein [Gammaproteobacteria bacterium]
MPATALGAFSHVTVGVASLEEAIDWWRRHVGFEVRVRRSGPDAELGRVWGMAAHRITGQALVATPVGPGGFAGAGQLHLVEFADPEPAVRAGARPHDRLPKNLDLYTRDIPTRYAELEALGVAFRSRWGEIPAGDLTFREVHLAGHDDLNVVLLEVIGPGYSTPLSPRGFAGVGPLVTIVGDAAAEASFYGDVLGMATTLALRLAGPEIEATVGLPPGAALDIRVFGDPAEPLGRIEVIEYEKLPGEDRYPRARPPATGILHASYRVRDLASLRERLRQAGVPVTEHGPVQALYGQGPLVSFRSPAGFRIEVQG